MNTQIQKILTILLILTASCAGLYGQDLRTLERQANSELRNAQNLMFSGRLEEAKAALDTAESLLATIREEYPASTQLASLDQRLQRQRTDLARRLPAEPAPRTEAPASPAVAPTEPGPAAPPRPLPRNTRQELRPLSNALQSLERTEMNRLERILEGDSHQMQQMETTLQRIQEKLDELPALHEKLLAVAASDDVTDHPEVVVMAERIQSITTSAGETMVRARAFVESAEAARAEAAKDAEDLAALFQKYRTTHFEPIGNLAFAYTTEDIHRAFTLLAEYETVKVSLEKTLAAYEEKYGTSRDEIERTTGSMANVYPWENFRERMRRMEEIPAKLAAKIKDTIESELADLERRHDFYRLQSHENLRTLSGFQKQHAPEAPAVEDLEQHLAADLVKYRARIDQRSWPACKGKAAERSAALQYFRETWGRNPERPYTVLDTVITGDWSVQKRDITGRPVMYGLPVLLAVQMPEDEVQGLARVFILTVRTPENTRATMEPPFTSDTVGNSYFIRTAAIR